MAVRRKMVPVQRGSDMCRLRRIVLFIFLALPLACDGNQTDSSPDSALECEHNSDCPGDLVCSPNGRCISQCISDKDCPQDFQCEKSACVESDAGGPKDAGGDPTSDASHHDASLLEDHYRADSGGDEVGTQDTRDGVDQGSDSGYTEVGSEPTDGSHPLCGLGDKRCSQDKASIELCLGDSWKAFQICTPALCESSDPGVRCGDIPDAGLQDAGTDSGDAGPIDCSSVDISATVSCCQDLAVASCDFEKKCNPDEFGQGGITIEECQTTVSSDCESFARVALCCSGVTYNNSAAYKCVAKVLDLTVLDCISGGVSECSEKVIYPGYDEAMCGI